jgi:predicted nucleotidyltransferase
MIRELDQHRSEVETICRRFGVRRLDLFGSGVAHRALPESSDLDFVVEFAPPIGPGYADRYFGLKEALEALFRKPVDLVVASAIRNPYFREAVEKTKAPVYAG